MDSNAVENRIRPLALRRKNALFAGHDEGAAAGWLRLNIPVRFSSLARDSEEYVMSIAESGVERSSSGEDPFEENLGAFIRHLRATGLSDGRISHGTGSV